MAQQQYCLRWNNHIQNMQTMFRDLQREEHFVDVGLVVEGKTIKCHKMVLAACSSYFREILINNPHEHPIILVTGVSLPEMQAIVDYMYRGEINVPQDNLPGLLKAASNFKIKGLVEDVDSKKENEPSESSAPQLPVFNGAHTNGFHSPSSLITPPYDNSPTEQNDQLPLWASHLTNNAHHLLPSVVTKPPMRHRLGSSYENLADPSPLSRKKLAIRRDTPILRNVLGGQDDSPVHQNGYSNGTNGNVSPNDSDRRNSSELSESMVDDEDRKAITPRKSKGKEWKRYKQYSREDIANAMRSVQRKELSALAAAKVYNIPSRTLYDKLKKAGIEPTRSSNCIKRRSESDDQMSIMSSAQFPYSGALNGAVYGSNNGSTISESESDPTDYSNGLPRSMESDDVPVDMTSPRSSPVKRDPDASNGYVSPPPKKMKEEDIEDLSTSKKLSNGVITPLVIKEEEEPNED